MKSAACSILRGLLIGVVLIQLMPSVTATARQEKPNQKRYLGPTVEYDSDFQITTLGNPKARELTEARRQRYNRRAPEPLAQLPYNWEGYEVGVDWYVGVPALPVDRSDAVIVGEVVSSEAHLSSDKTGVYSEFCIRVDEVLKSQSDNSLNIDDITIGEREGGIVRFQDGRLFEFRVFHQGMPQVERKYLFFLSRNKEGEDYSIFTAYEMRGGKIVPLDDSKAFNTFDGANEKELLKKVRAELVRTAPPPEERTQVKQ